MCMIPIAAATQAIGTMHSCKGASSATLVYSILSNKATTSERDLTKCGTPSTYKQP